MKKKLYIAAILRTNAVKSHESLILSLKPQGEYTSFVGFDKDEVTNRAVTQVQGFSRPDLYTVYVGVLSEVAIAPPVPQYQLQKAAF